MNDSYLSWSYSLNSFTEPTVEKIQGTQSIDTIIIYIGTEYKS